MNTSDYTTLAANFNKTAQAYSQGDFSYDGRVNVLDFNALATNYGKTLAVPSTGINLSAIIDNSNVDDSRVKIWWSSVAGTAHYTVDVSADGGGTQTIDTKSNDIAAYLDSFDTAFSGQKYNVRVNALDGSGATLATSNFVVVTADDGSGNDGEAPDLPTPAAVAAAPAVKTKMLLAVNGAYPLGGNVLDVTGNRWLEKMVEDTEISVKPALPQRTHGGAYRDNNPKEALLALLDKINTDHTGDTATVKKITAAEEQAVDVVLAGYSWGSNAVINLSRDLRAKKIGFAGGTSYTLEGKLPISLVITIDPVINGPFFAARVLKPVWDGVKDNTNRLVNHYQHKGGSTSVHLYYYGSTDNGDNYNFANDTQLSDPINPFPPTGVTGDQVPIVCPRQRFIKC